MLGTVGGSGQPPADSETIAQRKQRLRALDADASYSAADENPAVQALYTDFLGQPGSPKALELLHVRP